MHSISAHIYTVYLYQVYRASLENLYKSSCYVWKLLIDSVPLLMKLRPLQGLFSIMPDALHQSQLVSDVPSGDNDMSENETDCPGKSDSMYAYFTDNSFSKKL